MIVFSNSFVLIEKTNFGDLYRMVPKGSKLIFKGDKKILKIRSSEIEISKGLTIRAPKVKIFPFLEKVNILKIV